MSFAGLDGITLYIPLIHNRAVHLRISLAFPSALLEFLGCEKHFAALDSEETKHAQDTDRSSKSMNDHRPSEQMLLLKRWNSLRGYRWNCLHLGSALSTPARFNLQNGYLCESSMKEVYLCVEQDDSSNCNIKLQCWMWVTKQLHSHELLWYMTNISEQLIQHYSTSAVFAAIVLISLLLESR